MAIFIAALGDNVLSGIHDYTSTKQAWNKLQTRYPSKSKINKLSACIALLKLRLSNGTSVGDLVSMLEAQFSRLALMRSGVSQSMKVAPFISTVANWPKYGAMIPSANTFQKGLTKSN